MGISIATTDKQDGYDVVVETLSRLSEFFSLAEFNQREKMSGCPTSRFPCLSTAFLLEKHVL